jgi:hypothetical protein
VGRVGLLHDSDGSGHALRAVRALVLAFLEPRAPSPPLLQNAAALSALDVDSRAGEARRVVEAWLLAARPPPDSLPPRLRALTADH